MNNTYLFKLTAQDGTVKMDIVARTRKMAIKKASELSDYSPQCFSLIEVIENWETPIKAE